MSAEPQDSVLGKLTITEPGELMSFGHTEFEGFVRNPNRDRVWVVGYIDLGSKHGFFFKFNFIYLFG